MVYIDSQNDKIRINVTHKHSVFHVDINTLSTQQFFYKNSKQTTLPLLKVQCINIPFDNLDNHKHLSIFDDIIKRLFDQIKCL